MTTYNNLGVKYKTRAEEKRDSWEEFWVNLLGTILVTLLLFGSFKMAHFEWSKDFNAFYLETLEDVAGIKKEKIEDRIEKVAIQERETFESKFTFNLASFFTIATYLLGFRMKRFFYVKYKLRDMPVVHFQQYGKYP